MSTVCAETRGEDRDNIRVLAIVAVIWAVSALALYTWKISWVATMPRDAIGGVVGRDFLNFWMYGRAAWLPDPGRFYDPHIYNEMVTAFLGTHYPGQNWSYPPSIMLIAAPFGRLNYFPALLCWTVLGVGIFVWVVRRYADDRRLLIVFLCSPAAVYCLISGQSSFLTAAMLLTIVSCADRKPVLAGVLIGLLSLKPQLGLLFPVMLAASGRWRVFIAAAITTILIIAATAAAFGPQVWIDFVSQGIPAQNLVLVDSDRVRTPMYPTIFMNVRGAGASYAGAMTVQAYFSVLAAGLVFFAYRFRKNADPQLQSALFFASSVCVVPYLLSYDTLTISCLAALLLAAGKLDTRGQVLAILMYWLPWIQDKLGSYHIPGPALIPAVFAVYLLTRLKTTGNEGIDSTPFSGSLFRPKRALP
jgi:Glycosyltransferase family 87